VLGVRNQEEADVYGNTKITTITERAPSEQGGCPGLLGLSGEPTDEAA